MLTFYKQMADIMAQKMGGISMFQILVVEDDKALNQTVCAFLKGRG